MIAAELKKLISQTVEKLGLPPVDFTLEHPGDSEHGDYATNVALILAKQTGQNPRQAAEQLVRELNKNKPDMVSKIEIAGPGFINFRLTPEFFVQAIERVIKEGEDFGKNRNLTGQKIIVEYTDPNPFKEFHIGHLMSNAIGEALSRLVEWSGAEVKRACYQGDIGLHVAKAIWGLGSTGKKPLDIATLAKAYVRGAQAYEENEPAKAEILELNKKIYQSSDEAINKLYEAGRQVSLDYFAVIYRKLGTAFDYFFFESATGRFGKEIVEANLDKNKGFEKAGGAIIFRGENYDKKLHTRVFINSKGLPTYEAKELGLAKIKYDKYPYDRSIVITGNEVNDYFLVMLKALEQVFPELAAKTNHLSHGMLRSAAGKMSSRTGEVITAEALLAQVGERVRAKINSAEKGDTFKNTPGATLEKLIEQIAVGAIKFSILKQAIGRDIVFDLDKSVSFEGDSGPYLQYTYARTRSILAKAKEAGIKSETQNPTPDVSAVEKLVYRLPEVVEKACPAMGGGGTYAPQQVITYLLELAGAYNSFYAVNKIVDPADPASPYRVALTAAVGQALKNGLTILGIPVPERM